MADVENNNNEEKICKSRSLPTQLLEVSKPILQILKEDINTPINVIFEKNSFTENVIQNHQCINRNVFEAFYEDYIDFKSYINDILKNNLKQTIALSSENDVQKQQPKQHEEKSIYNNTINELNKEIQLLKEENTVLKQENKTFLKVIELMPMQQNKQPKDCDNEASWKEVKTKNKFTLTSPQLVQFPNDERNTTVPPILSKNRFQSLEHEIDFSADTTLPETNISIINRNRIETRGGSSNNINNINTQNNKRPNVCITESYLQNQKEVTRKKVVPGNRSYAETSTYGRKILFIGDSHINRINKNRLNQSFQKAKCIVKPFSGAKIEDLTHYIIPNLQQQKPDIVVIHVGSNNAAYNKLHFDPRLLAENIIKIGKTCIEYGVEDVVISGIFVKESIRLSSFIRKVNDELCELCSVNNFHYISNDSIVRKHLCGDGVHLKNIGTNVFAENIVNYLNSTILGNQD